MEEGNIFDKFNSGHGDDRKSISRSSSTDIEFEKLKDKNGDESRSLNISFEDLQELVENMKIKHRAEIDAIMNEQGVYKNIKEYMRI